MTEKITIEEERELMLIARDFIEVYETSALTVLRTNGIECTEEGIKQLRLTAAKRAAHLKKRASR